jgi:branched-chain amino acid transport system ATP-binding protein
MTALLKGEGISLSFRGINALTDVSFEAHEASVLGVIGPNGAGKTALLNCICGVYRPHTGSISFAGNEILGKRPEAIAKLGIGRTFQGMDHFSDFMVDDYVMLGRTPSVPASCFASSIAFPLIDRAERRERNVALDVLERCGLSEYARHPLCEVPYGIQKQVDVARVIASNCRLALLDEPTSGTTSSEREIISRSVELLVERGISVMLIDHDVEFVARHCESLVALDAGTLLAAGPTTQVLSDGAVREAFLGLAV